MSADKSRFISEAAAAMREAFPDHSHWICRGTNEGRLVVSKPHWPDTQTIEIPVVGAASDLWGNGQQVWGQHEQGHPQMPFARTPGLGAAVVGQGARATDAKAISWPWWTQPEASPNLRYGSENTCRPLWFASPTTMISFGRTNDATDYETLDPGGAYNDTLGLILTSRGLAALYPVWVTANAATNPNSYSLIIQELGMDGSTPAPIVISAEELVSTRVSSAERRQGYFFWDPTRGRYTIAVSAGVAIIQPGVSGSIVGWTSYPGWTHPRAGNFAVSERYGLECSYQHWDIGTPFGYTGPSLSDSTRASLMTWKAPVLECRYDQSLVELAYLCDGARIIYGCSTTDNTPSTRWPMLATDKGKREWWLWLNSQEREDDRPIFRFVSIDAIELTSALRYRLDASAVPFDRYSGMTSALNAALTAASEASRSDPAGNLGLPAVTATAPIELSPYTQGFVGPIGGKTYATSPLNPTSYEFFRRDYGDYYTGYDAAETGFSDVSSLFLPHPLPGDNTGGSATYQTASQFPSGIIDDKLRAIYFISEPVNVAIDMVSSETLTPEWFVQGLNWVEPFILSGSLYEGGPPYYDIIIGEGSEQIYTVPGHFENQFYSRHKRGLASADVAWKTWLVCLQGGGTGTATGGLVSGTSKTAKIDVTNYVSWDAGGTDNADNYPMLLQVWAWAISGDILWVVRQRIWNYTGDRTFEGKYSQWVMNLAAASDPVKREPWLEARNRNTGALLGKWTLHPKNDLAPIASPERKLVGLYDRSPRLFVGIGGDSKPWATVMTEWYPNATPGDTEPRQAVTQAVYNPITHEFAFTESLNVGAKIVGQPNLSEAANLVIGDNKAYWIEQSNTVAKVSL